MILQAIADLEMLSRAIPRVMKAIHARENNVVPRKVVQKTETTSNNVKAMERLLEM